MNLDVIDKSFADDFTFVLKELLTNYCTEIYVANYKKSKSLFGQF